MANSWALGDITRAMPPRLRTLAPLALVAQAACLVPNWLYDGDGATGTTGTTEATTTTTSEASTSASTSTSTSEAESEAATSTSTGAETDPDTGEPPECWGRAPTDWDEIVQILDLQLGVDPRSARLSPDGLTLFYIADPIGRPYVAERPSRDQPFVAGQPLNPLSGLAADLGVDYPAFRPDPRGLRELILSVGFPGDLYVAADPAWDAPTPLANLNLWPPFQDSHPSLSEDGARLIFSRNDGPVNPDLGDGTVTVFNFYEATRPPGSPAATPFADPTLLAISYADPPKVENYAHYAPCTALAPDGRRFFFGSTFPDVLADPATLVDALDIFFAERPALGEPFAPAVELALFHEHAWQTCPNSVSRDGCELIFHRFVLGGDMAVEPGEDKYKLYLARRAP